MTTNLRPATKEDSLIAAALLAETNGEFGVEVLGLGKPELQLSALQQWFADSGNRFSYQYSTVAEKDGTPAGLLLAFPGSKLSRLELGCGKCIFGIYGFFGALKMIRLNKSLAGNKEAEKDEYLIAHLAVDERFRRQGIAQTLLDKAGQDALSLGLNKLVLEVEIDNEKAITLYQKAGFEIVNTVYFSEKTDRFGCLGFYKMSKNL
jgi:ribosomal protein S18 acetylase RimI-like enzyme